MKKILAILAMAVSGSVFAASATLEYQNINGVQNTPNDQRNINLTVKESINSNFAGDVQLSNTWNNTATSTAANSFRAEGGLTGSAALFGPLSGYTRVALGQKFTTTNNFTYYSVEPGVTMPLGAGFSAKVGYRFRNAFDTANNDTTRTWRAGVAYDINKNNTVGVGYDSVRGDSNQNVVKVNYTRGF
jgi:long-subunit fatty acid transport protein